MRKTGKVIYRCPHCGKTLTEEEYEKLTFRYCDCGFMARDEKGNVWFPREYYEFKKVIM